MEKFIWSFVWVFVGFFVLVSMVGDMRGILGMVMVWVIIRMVMGGSRVNRVDRRGRGRYVVIDKDDSAFRRSEKNEVNEPMSGYNILHEEETKYDTIEENFFLFKTEVKGKKYQETMFFTKVTGYL